MSTVFRSSTFLCALSIAATVGLLVVGCGGNSSVPEVPDEPYESEPTGQDEAAAVIGPGPNGTNVEGVAYPHSEQREGYQSAQSPEEPALAPATEPATTEQPSETTPPASPASNTPGARP